MTKYLSESEQLFKDIENQLTVEITILREGAIESATKILNKEVSLQMLNGIIGGKNNTYVDSVKTQFLDFKDFFAKWIKGLNDTFSKESAVYLRYNRKLDWDKKASFRNVRLLQNEKILSYAQKFLERNFYRYIDHRVRVKPDERLWEIWFGYDLTYGLLIAPVKKSTGWSIDKSEIRKVKYNYWTIGHLMETGLIVPDQDIPTKFSNLEYFYHFYLSVLGRLSKSDYEKDIYNKYVLYLKQSSDPLDEPFLIPEFRYGGLLKKHEYRLDFTILNQHSVDFMGFEISPASSHMSVGKLKEKQSIVNVELKEKWVKEMTKRNRYFDSFGITTVTFTDIDLKNIDDCFDKMKKILCCRPETKPNLKNQLERLNSF